MKIDLKAKIIEYKLNLNKVVLLLIANLQI